MTIIVSEQPAAKGKHLMGVQNQIYGLFIISYIQSIVTNRVVIVKKNLPGTVHFSILSISIDDAYNSLV